MKGLTLLTLQELRDQDPRSGEKVFEGLLEDLSLENWKVLRKIEVFGFCLGSYWEGYSFPYPAKRLGEKRFFSPLVFFPAIFKGKRGWIYLVDHEDLGHHPYIFLNRKISENQALSLIREAGFSLGTEGETKGDQAETLALLKGEARFWWDPLVGICGVEVAS